MGEDIHHWLYNCPGMHHVRQQHFEHGFLEAKPFVEVPATAINRGLWLIPQHLRAPPRNPPITNYFPEAPGTIQNMEDFFDPRRPIYTDASADFSDNAYLARAGVAALQIEHGKISALWRGGARTSCGKRSGRRAACGHPGHQAFARSPPGR